MTASNETLPANPAVTARLMAALPESLWSEAGRRLRLVPELWRLAADEQVLGAFCALPPTAASWRPAPLGLAAYAARHPECRGSAAQWLAGEGRERVNLAYVRLVTPAKRLEAVEEALPAAMALRWRGQATKDWNSIAAESARQAERWRLPLQFLWGLLESPDELFTALVGTSPESAALAGFCLAVNMDESEAAELAAAAAQAPARNWMALTRALQGLGAGGHAAMIARSVAPAMPVPGETASTGPEDAAGLGPQVEQAMLLSISGDFPLSRPALIQAWTRARRISAALAGRIGALALEAGDPASAMAGYQDAVAENPADAGLRAGLARALVLAGQAQEALAALARSQETSASPQTLVATARAQAAAGQTADAIQTLQPIDPRAIHAPALVSEGAQVLYDLGLIEDAVRWMLAAADSARTDGRLYLTAARWLLQRGDAARARESAAEAVLLSPDSPEVRDFYGSVLLEIGESAEAVKHFQTAVVLDPARHSAGLGLAQAALASGQPSQAREAAKKVLSVASEPVVKGEAHILLGQALSAQQQDEAAFEHFNRASALAPAAPEPWRAMARHFHQRGDRRQAVSALEAGRQALALAGSQHVAPLLVDLADAYEAQDRHAEAITALREATLSAPQSATIHKRLGSLLRQHASASESVDVLRYALNLRPGDPAILHELGQALEGSGRMDEAWSAYQQAVLGKPESAEPYLNLGRVTLAQCHNKKPGSAPLQAVAALKEAVRRAPENAEAHALLALAYHDTGALENAVESYRAALRLAPGRTDWSLGLGRACLRLGRSDVAVAALTEALQHAPESQASEVSHTLARAYAQSKLWPEVLQSAEAALRQDPANPAIFKLQGEAYQQTGQAEKAVEAWRRAVNLSPRDTQLQVEYARCLLSLGRVDEARAAFAQALSLGPDDPDVQLAAGRAFMDLGEVDQAYEVLGHAAKLAARSAEVQAACGEAAARAQQYQAAQAAFLRASELEPENPSHLRNAGKALWSLERGAAAVSVWQRALALAPDDPDTLALLGTALVGLGQHSEALEILGRAAAHSPHSADVAREAARAALAIEDLEQAGEYLENAIRLNPGDAEARYLLGQVRARGGQTDEALGYFRQASRLNPGDGRYLAASGRALAAQDKLAEAVRWMDQAVAASPDLPEVQREAGEVFLRAGRAEDAVQALRRLAAARPRDAEAHISLARAHVMLAEEAELESAARPFSHATRPANAEAEMMSALQQAAALGADPQTVRYWMGRAKAASGSATEAAHLLNSLSAVGTGMLAKSPEFYRSLGSALRKSGRLEQAREALQQAGPVESADGHLYLELGRTLLGLKDTAGALAALQRAATLAPNSALSQYCLAEALLQSGERVEAAQVLQRAVALKPEADRWHHQLAGLYRQLGDPAGALAHFQRAAELVPANGEYAADLARALARDGDLNAAGELLRRAVEADPQQTQTWTELGQVQLALGQAGAALQSFDRALQLAPALVPALIGGARASLIVGDLHEAANRAETAARLAPQDTEALICLADVQAGRGDAAGAEASYALAAEHSPRPGAALLSLGKLRHSRGKHREAAEALERAASALPDSDESYILLGDAYQELRQLDSAVKAYREAVRLAPRNARHLLRLGRALRQQGQLDQALAHLTTAREIAQHDDEILREVGLVYEQRRQFAQALDMYQHAVKAAPHASANYARAGLVLKQMKAYPEALRALERAVALDPKNLEATKQLTVVSALTLMHGQPAAGQ